MFGGGFCPGFGGFRGVGGGFGYHSFFPGMIFMMIFWVALIAALIIFIVSRRKRGTSSTSMELLNRRFASGEITEEEYLRRKQILKDGK